MTFKSRSITEAIKGFRFDNYKPKTQRDRLAGAIASLGLSPDEKIRITNLLVSSENKYEDSIKLLGEMATEKIKIYF